MAYPLFLWFLPTIFPENLTSLRNRIFPTQPPPARWFLPFLLRSASFCLFSIHSLFTSPYQASDSIPGLTLSCSLWLFVERINHRHQDVQETLNSICDHRLANNFMKTSFCDVEAKVDILTIFSFLFKKHFSASLMCN